MKNINLLLSSISFLQFYIPIVIEANKRNYNCIFYVTPNIKDYANPFNITNKNLLLMYINQYKIKIGNNNNIEDGPIICVDGDTYGPQKHNQFSLLNHFKINKKHKIYSLQEHLNFIWSYNNYKDKVDYILFPSEYYAKLYNKISNKNVYIGNTKYDHILDKESIYKKYKLSSNQKYVLVLFPKGIYQVRHNILPEQILNFYKYLYHMGFKIIVKSRPKDSVFKNCKGDKCVISDIFPNESLELMKISELCILFSSSAIEETIMMEIPTLDLAVDTKINKRLEFLYTEETIQQIINWRNIKYKNFLNTILKLSPKNSDIYKELKKKYLFEGNISSKIFDLINSTDN